MNVPKKALWTTLGAAALTMMGCDVFLGGRSRDEPVYVQRERVYVAQPPVAEPQYVIVQQAPPPIIVERRPPPPSAEYVWIDGSWNWDNQRYSWQAGRYARPPEPGVVWIAPRYDPDAHGYRYTRGQWAKQNPSDDRDHGRDRR